MTRKDTVPENQPASGRRNRFEENMAYASSWRLRVAIALAFPIFAIVVAPVLEPVSRSSTAIVGVTAAALVVACIGLWRIVRS
jgi:hypothetical protein